MVPANVADYRELARRRIPKVLFDYVDGGSYTEHTLRANSADFAKVQLRQRVLVDVSNISLKTEVLGQELGMPMVLSPVGMAGMYARRGEVQAARAGLKAGIPLCLSSMAICDVTEVVKGCGSPIWFQLYMLKDRGYMKELLARATELGCPVLAFTVDLPIPGTRYRDIRNGLAGDTSWHLPLRRAWDGITHLPWVWDVWLNGRPHVFGNIAPAQRQMPAVVPGEAIADVAIAGAGHRKVDGEHQHRTAELGRPGQQLLHVAAVLQHVELEPDRRAVALCDLTEVADGHARQAKGYAGLAGGARGLHFAAAGVHAGHAHRRQHQRQVEVLAQDLGLQGDVRDIDQHPLAQGDLFEVGRIGAQGGFRIGAAVDVVEQHLGNPAAGQLPVVGDIGGCHLRTPPPERQ